MFSCQLWKWGEIDCIHSFSKIQQKDDKQSYGLYIACLPGREALKNIRMQENFIK